MNVIAAMKDTVALWESHAWSGIDLPESLSGKHIAEMLVEAEKFDNEFSYGKLCRWLGWMQAATVAAGIATLDDMKAINKRHAGEDGRTEPSAEQVEAGALLDRIHSLMGRAVGRDGGTMQVMFTEEWLQVLELLRRARAALSASREGEDGEEPTADWQAWSAEALEQKLRDALALSPDELEHSKAARLFSASLETIGQLRHALSRSPDGWRAIDNAARDDLINRLRKVADDYSGWGRDIGADLLREASNMLNEDRVPEPPVKNEESK